ncbi:MAG: ABC transporter permease, partial [Pseudolysinimonas sp.]
MTTVKASRTAVPLPRGTAARRLSVALSSRPRTRLGLLLSAPLLWLGLVYIAALAALLITAFWTTDTFTGQVRTEWTLDNIITVV